MMNAETDFGPRVSFELNSLFPSSLCHVRNKVYTRRLGLNTSGFHLRAADSRIALRGYEEIRPLAPIDARNTSDSVQ